MPSVNINTGRPMQFWESSWILKWTDVASRGRCQQFFDVGYFFLYPVAYHFSCVNLQKNTTQIVQHINGSLAQDGSRQIFGHLRSIPDGRSILLIH